MQNILEADLKVKGFFKSPNEHSNISEKIKTLLEAEMRSMYTLWRFHIMMGGMWLCRVHIDYKK